MPYRNLSGWLGTGAVFMSVATLFWQRQPLRLTRAQLWVPLAIYLVNFAFGAVITVSELDVKFWIPTAIGAALGVVPAIALWWMAQPSASLNQPQIIVEEVAVDTTIELPINTPAVSTTVITK